MGLIKIQLKSILTFRFITIGMLISILFGITQAVRLSNELLIKNEKGNISDFLLYTFGGWQSPMTLLSITQWLLLILFVLLASHWSFLQSKSWMTMVMSRYTYRFSWWVSNYCAQFFICIITILLLVIGHIIAGLLFFDMQLEWSTYTLDQYVLLSKRSPVQFFQFGFIILITGLYSLVFLQMIIQTIFHTKRTSIILFVTLIMLGFAYIYHQLPYELSPVFYPSTIIAFTNGYTVSILFNIGINILFFILSFLFIRNKNIL